MQSSTFLDIPEKNPAHLPDLGLIIASKTARHESWELEQSKHAQHANMPNMYTE